MALYETCTIGELTLTGTKSTLKGTTSIAGTTVATGVTALLSDASGKVLLATGTTLPADTGALYAKGCLFIDTDVATGTSGLYVNVGTSASCVFKLVSNAA